MTAPSQVSQPDLSFTEFSQELIRKADKIAQRVDVMVGRVNAHRAETTPASASAPTTQSPTAMQYRAPASGKLSRIRLDKLALMHTFLERRSSVQATKARSRLTAALTTPTLRTRKVRNFAVRPVVMLFFGLGVARCVT
jgi:hypothetical protein